MFAALAAQFVFAFPLQHRLDIPLGVVFILPAVIDWALGRFQPHRFSNPWRTFTGALLGLGLARSLFIHVQQPFPRVLVVQGALVSVIVLPVLFVTYRLHRTE